MMMTVAGVVEWQEQDGNFSSDRRRVLARDRIEQNSAEGKCDLMENGKYIFLLFWAEVWDEFECVCASVNE